MHDSPAAAARLGETYRDKNAVHVFGLAGLVCTHEVGQALDVVDAHHVDVVVEAERLDEREVDLEGDVALVLLIGGEHAECHAVWVTVGKEKMIRSPRSRAMLPGIKKRQMSQTEILTHS